MDDSSVRDTSDQISQMHRFPMPSLSNRSSSKSTILSSSKNTYKNPDSAVNTVNTVNTDLQLGLLPLLRPGQWTYRQSRTDSYTPSHKDHVSTVAQNYNTVATPASFTQERSRPVYNTTKTVHGSVTFREDSPEPPSAALEYLEMLPRSSRRRSSRRQIAVGCTKALSSAADSTSILAASSSPAIALPSATRSILQLCNLPDCFLEKLNWSAYCYKHQCRAFKCSDHVYRSSSAYCERHHQESDVRMAYRKQDDL